jgi:hypothetical protein
MKIRIHVVCIFTISCEEPSEWIGLGFRRASTGSYLDLQAANEKNQHRSCSTSMARDGRACEDRAPGQALTMSEETWTQP